MYMCPFWHHKNTTVHLGACGLSHVWIIYLFIIDHLFIFVWCTQIIIRFLFFFNHRAFYILAQRFCIVNLFKTAFKFPVRNNKMAIRNKAKKKEANSFRLAKKYSSHRHTAAARHSVRHPQEPPRALPALYRLQECNVSLVIYKHTHNKRAAAV